MYTPRPSGLLLTLLAALCTISLSALYNNVVEAQSRYSTDLPHDQPTNQSRIAGDRDDDGVADEFDADNDNDTIPDVYEGDDDSDLDGIPDHFDLDSDNDGLPDIIESGLDQTLILELDANRDGRIDSGIAIGRNGLANAVELVVDSTNLRNNPADSDGDGVADFRDLDSDNDGLSDRAESGSDNELVFAQFQPLVDVNRDGWHDTVNAPFAFPDQDNDGLYNHLDTDSDQDGESDLRETAGESRDRDNNGRIDQFLDFDSNGYHDQLQGAPLQFVDSDNDGNADHLDLDSDNDGVFDVVEAGRADINGDGMTDENLQPPIESPATDSVTQDSNPVSNDPGSTTLSSDNGDILVTGLDGNAHGGCVAFGTANGHQSSFDPLLWLIPAFVLFSRRRQHFIKAAWLRASTKLQR